MASKTNKKAKKAKKVKEKRCEALTKTGTRCKNKTSKGRYCKFHSNEKNRGHIKLMKTKISRAEAKEVMAKRTARSRYMDAERKARRVEKEPNKYWKSTNGRYFDIEGIDDGSAKSKAKYPRPPKKKKVKKVRKAKAKKSPTKPKTKAKPKTKVKPKTKTKPKAKVVSKPKVLNADISKNLIIRVSKMGGKIVEDGKEYKLKMNKLPNWIWANEQGCLLFEKTPSQLTPIVATNLKEFEIEPFLKKFRSLKAKGMYLKINKLAFPSHYILTYLTAIKLSGAKSFEIGTKEGFATIKIHSKLWMLIGADEKPKIKSGYNLQGTRVD